jgi:hypothetical protein
MCRNHSKGETFMKYFLRSAFWGGVMLAMSTPSFALPNLITNGSLETVTPGFSTFNVCTTITGTVYALCTATGWTGAYQIGKGPTPGIGPTFTVPQPEPDGSDVLILQGGPASAAATTQFDVATAGTYQLSFFIANRSTPGFNGPQTVQLQLDGKLVNGGTFSQLPATWAHELLPLALSVGTHNLTFQGFDPSGADVTAFVDNVALTAPQAAPEPGGWALTLVGITALSLLRSRRQ